MNLERIGPYRIIRLLGKGGMGAVYEGLHEAIERRVAIKVLFPELSRRADIATRFINEAKAVNRIDHPGLVQVTDHGRLPDGTAYIVMEFLKGETLGQRLKRLSNRLSVPEVIRLGRQMASALAAAHDKEIVHRDLKPDNIMIVPNPDTPGGELIKILDFGIAKVAEEQSGISEAHTRADALLGTPRYMSPEQCRGSGGVDAKSDVYSLGVIFYEVLCGQPPFAGSAHGELIVQHIMHEPPPLGPRVEPGTPDTLVQLVQRMLVKDKEMRPSMRQAVGELDRLGGYLSGVVQIPQLHASGISMPHPVGPVTPGALHASLPGSHSAPSYPSLGQGLVPSLGGGQLSHSLPGGTLAPGTLPAAASSTLGLAAGQAPASARPRWAVAVAIGSVVGAVAVGVVLVVSLNKPPPAPPLLPPPVIKTAVKPPEPVAQQKSVHWELTTQPAGAKVVRQRDGQVLGVTPLSLSNPLGVGSEKVRIVLQGYTDEAAVLDLGQDFNQNIELKRKTGRDVKKGGKTQKGYVRGDLTVVD
jgi:serine/threonine protein kinase